jgi:hypothetical protein
MSVATIVSGAPFRLCETHPQCVPYEIALPAADFMNGGLSTLPIQDGYHALYIDEKRGFMDVPDEGVELAKRTVEDMLRAQLFFDPQVHPAIFSVPGNLNEAMVKKQFPELVKNQLEAQRKWFVVLVQRADSSWAKGKNLAEISDLHRAAVRFLNLQRDYVDYGPESMINCPACFTLVRKAAAVCYACKAVIDAEKYKEMTFAK